MRIALGTTLVTCTQKSTSKPNWDIKMLSLFRRNFTSTGTVLKDILKSGKTLFIENEHVSSVTGAELDSISPHDGSVYAKVANAKPEDAERAIKSARASFETFRWTKPEERAEMLKGIASTINEHVQELSEMESLDMGKPIAEAIVDIETCRDLFAYYGDVTPDYMKDKYLPDEEEGVRSRIVHDPVGVIGMVTPWNYPLMQAVVKVAPALAAGCTMVLKPSRQASLTCSVLGAVARDAGVPSGVLSVLTGDSRDGSAADTLVNHPDVDVLSFTGSGPVGQKLLQASAAHLRPTGLELGGKGSLIVFDDVQDIDAAVDWAMLGIFYCAGQVCSATSRLLVQDTIADQFIARLKEKAQNIRMGHPLDENTQLGPMVSQGQYEDVHRFLDLARAENCEFVCGGERLEGDGYYIPPTVLSKVPRDGVIWNQEIFGPVLAVRTFSTEDEAVIETNNTEFGLSNGVLSGDADRASRVARRLDSGIIWSNCNQVIYPSTPFGGMKKSGAAREYGVSGLHEYIVEKTIIEAGADKAWWWYGK